MKTNKLPATVRLELVCAFVIADVEEIRRELMYPSQLATIRHSILGYVNAWVG